MKSLPRERIALVVFMACIALILGGIVAYLLAGHSWNVAASHIDDATGELDGYHVILYEGTSTPSESRVDAKGKLSFHPASLASTEGEYRDKGASVIKIDTSDLDEYNRPIVIERDGYRIGIVSFEDDATKREMQERCTYLNQHNCDTVVAICRTSQKAVKVEGFDILLTLEDNSGTISRTHPHLYHVQMPSVGSIGAILISPSEVASSRVVTRS
jgi:hypothetical protein